MHPSTSDVYGPSDVRVLWSDAVQCMGQLFTEKREDSQTTNDALNRGFDGRVDSTCVVRIVGATEFSTNGNDLLRSIIMQIREEYDPQNHLQV